MTADLLPLDGSPPVPLCRRCRIRTADPCRFCGDDVFAFLRAFQSGHTLGHDRGLQDAHFATYSANVDATAQREAAEAARQSLQRWHE